MSGEMGPHLTNTDVQWKGGHAISERNKLRDFLP